MKDKQYLGDAVYASFDGEYINLTTEDGIRATNSLSLEPAVIRNFLRYFASISPLAVDILSSVAAEFKEVSEVER